MTEHGERRPVVLQAHEPSLRRFIQLGKVVPITWQYGHVEWAYVNNLSAELRKAGSFGVARCVVALMCEWDVPRVLYYYDGMYYSAFRDQIVVECRPWAMSYRPRYFNVPRRLWEELGGFLGVRIPRTNNVLELTWDVPDSAWRGLLPEHEMVQQLSLV